MIDSTGLKNAGDGEWHATKHGTSNKRRSWRKLHIGVDGQGYIVDSEPTGSGEDDPSTVPSWVRQLMTPKRCTTPCLGAARRASESSSPPATRTPSATGAWPQRDAAVARIDEIGRRAWRKEAGANRQARVENAMFRLKRITGDRLRAKDFEAQKRDAEIRVNVLNRMLDLGTPQSENVVA